MHQRIVDEEGNERACSRQRAVKVAALYRLCIISELMCTDHCPILQLNPSPQTFFIPFPILHQTSSTTFPTEPNLPTRSPHSHRLAAMRLLLISLLALDASAIHTSHQQ